MFLFYHREQVVKNISYYKGVLFESLLRRYLTSLGYDVELRKKRNSLEYDIDGHARLNKMSLIGEAKAHGAPVPAHDLAAFVGKLVPISRFNPSVFGIFLSTSRLSAEADDYYSTLHESGLTIKVLSGDKLLSDIAHQLALPSRSVLENAVRQLGCFPLSTHMLVVEDGALLLQISATDGGVTPAVFSVMRSDGQLITDPKFLDELRLRVSELQELVPGYPRPPSSPASPTPRSPILEGLVLGSDWADYRLPAPPAFFIGRRTLAERVAKNILGDQHPGLIQLKSRSGVGKSSLMAFLAHQLTAAGATTSLFDARNIKSALDIWAIIQRLTSAEKQAADFGEMEQQLSALRNINERRAVLLIDQFEACFSDPELYAAFELLAIAIVNQRPHVCLVLARKNDLLTTFDDQRISLDRLNDLSESFILDDFNADEAIQLLDAISASANRPVPPEIKSYILEFAQGFPWLLKRTMAHVITLLQRGLKPVELVSTSFRLDELFEEELADLDELERDYLIRIAPLLPSTYHQLAGDFDEDPILPKVLDRLTRERLLRLGGSTYDTYNDVFKEYIIYRRLPEFRLSFVYRLGEFPVMNAFWRLFEVRRLTTNEIGKTLRKARGTTFNLIRELRNVGLLDRDASGAWVIPESALDAYERQRLGEYVRQQLTRNALVTELIAHLQSVDTLSREELARYLQARFPFIDASPATWKNYSNNLVSWLKLVELVHDQGDAIRPSELSRVDAAKRIANLRHRAKKTAHKVTPVAFLPGTWWRHVEETVALLQERPGAPLRGKQRGALIDLNRLHLASLDGTLFVTTTQDVETAICAKLHGQPYQQFWDEVRRGRRPWDCIGEIFGLAGLAPLTVRWRAKILMDWGLKLGLISETDRKFATARRLGPRRASLDDLPLFQQAGPRERP